MTKNKKTLVCLIRAFFGDFGIDNFIMKKIPTAICSLVWCLVLIAILALTVVLAISAKGMMIFVPILVGVFMIVRKLLFFITGLVMLKRPEEEIVKTYE